MNVPIVNRIVRIACGFVLIGALTFSTGCSQWHPFQKDGVSGRPNWFQMRPPGSSVNAKGTGVLPQAREIERNLGY